MTQLNNYYPVIEFKKCCQSSRFGEDLIFPKTAKLIGGLKREPKISTPKNYQTYVFSSVSSILRTFFGLATLEKPIGMES